MKTCNRCLIEKDEVEFYKKPTAKDGLFWWCRSCHKDYVKTKYAKAYSNPEFAARENQRVAKYYKDNPDKDPRHWPTGEKAAAITAKYRASKKRRTPIWLSKDDLWLMEQFYELAALRTKATGFKWQVDHVIPIQGKLASGLHVPDNLQVLPAKLNQRKSNRYAVQ